MKEESKRRRVSRVVEGRLIMGVAAGTANLLGLKPWFVRCAFVTLAVVTRGVWVLAYMLLGFVLPSRDEDLLAEAQDIQALKESEGPARGGRRERIRMRNEQKSWYDPSRDKSYRD